MNKMDLLISYENRDKLGKEEFEVMKSLYQDHDSLVRSEVASLLVHFHTAQSRNMLLELIKDSDDLVRCEAYDSLCIFHELKVEQQLKQSILNEGDNLARSYAILSWAEIASQLTQDNDFVEMQINNEASDECILSWLYAKYIFGNEEALMEILKFLKHSDYHLRCSALNLLEEFICESNKDYIHKEISKLLMVEKNKAVIETIKKIYNE